MESACVFVDLVATQGMLRVVCQVQEITVLDLQGVLLRAMHVRRGRTGCTKRAAQVSTNKLAMLDLQKVLLRAVLSVCICRCSP